MRASESHSQPLSCFESASRVPTVLKEELDADLRAGLTGIKKLMSVIMGERARDSTIITLPTFKSRARKRHVLMSFLHATRLQNNITIS